MKAGAKAHYDGVVAFSQMEFTADLKKISSRSLASGDCPPLMLRVAADSGALISNGVSTTEMLPGADDGSR